MISLGNINLDGPSRHRIKKGIILVPIKTNNQITPKVQYEIIKEASLSLDSNIEIIPLPEDPSLVSIHTPLSFVHTPYHRAKLIDSLGYAWYQLMITSIQRGYFPLGSGINPLNQQQKENQLSFSADIHEIEILSDLEVNRIYNLFRQFLPELIAITSNSAILHGKAQKDLSTRMRLNPDSFTPPSLSFFSSKQLERVRRLVIKENGIGDLSKLDITPVKDGVITLRFVDSQCSLAYINALIILFQAIAIQGRSLARQGSQMPILHRKIIGENKALAIETGPGAVLNPDRKRNIDQRLMNRSWYQDRQESIKASAALLEMIQLRTVRDSQSPLSALIALNVTYDEIVPWLLGCELRKLHKPCLVNYGEYHKRLVYVEKENWQRVIFSDQKMLIEDKNLDLVAEFNKQRYEDISNSIQERWEGLLTHRRAKPGKQSKRK